MCKRFRICSRCVILFAVVAIVFSQSGCNLHFDPATTVTVEITGIRAQSDRDKVFKTLTGMVDGSSHMSSSSSFGDTMTVKLSPVSDVKVFSQKIKFGHVKEIDGRTVKVQYVK